MAQARLEARMRSSRSGVLYFLYGGMMLTFIHSVENDGRQLNSSVELVAHNSSCVPGLSRVVVVDAGGGTKRPSKRVARGGREVPLGAARDCLSLPFGRSTLGTSEGGQARNTHE